MYTDEQFEALHLYVWQKSVGDGSRLASTVLDGKYTMFLLVEGAIKHVGNENYRITHLGEAIFWLNSYHHLKDVIFEASEYAKASITEAGDNDALKTRMGAILDLLSGGNHDKTD